MFEKLKADIMFHQLFKRPNINKAYKMVPPTDSWYDTITTVHNSLAEIQKLPHEVVEIVSHDGLRMKAIYYPNNSDKTMIWVHGYTSHAERESAFPSLFYRSLGFNVLIPYLRAHSLSQGKYISFGALEPQDMQRWVDKINQIVPNGKIVIHGLSMGGGIALNMSQFDMPNVKCIVSDAPSRSVEGLLTFVANSTFKKGAEKVVHYCFERFKKEFGCDARDFDSAVIVEKSKYPILLSAGSNEQLEDYFEILKDANPMPTDIVILPGCNHGNGMYKQTEMYQGAIKGFLEKYL